MIWLDNAATTLQKPPRVKGAMLRAVSGMSAPGRGGHRFAAAAAETAFQCRELAAEMFGAPGPERVVFTFNATHGLNMAIRTIVKPGMRVVISGYEHNAVVRPLHALGADIHVAAGKLFHPESVLEAFSREITKETGLVVLNHVSNVFGFVQPAEKIAKLCRERNVPFILDASQSAGTLPISLEGLGAAFIAMPGHKGLYGPQGTGLLLCGTDAAPLLYGGTGSASMMREMPGVLPDAGEAGTHNMPGVAGLLEGLRYVKRTGTERIAAHERVLIRFAGEGLRKIPGIRVFCAEDPSVQTGVLSFVSEKYDAETAATLIDREGIALRAGLHCAPLAHETAGTLPDGTVRLSVSAFTGRKDIAEFLRVVRNIETGTKCVQTENRI